MRSRVLQYYITGGTPSGPVEFFPSCRAREAAAMSARWDPLWSQGLPRVLGGRWA
jgi:hypothetical protein